MLRVDVLRNYYFCSLNKQKSSWGTAKRDDNLCDKEMQAQGLRLESASKSTDLMHNGIMNIVGLPMSPGMKPIDAVN